jgi:hypothetical protein
MAALAQLVAGRGTHRVNPVGDPGPAPGRQQVRTQATVVPVPARLAERAPAEKHRRLGIELEVHRPHHVRCVCGRRVRCC